MHVNYKPRPPSNRQHTSSPTIFTASVTCRVNRPRVDSRASDEHVKHVPAAAPLPTPPADAATVTAITSPVKPLSNPPTPRVASPRPGQKRKTKLRQPTDPSELPTTTSTTPKAAATTTANVLLNASLTPYIDTSVPPINVLIVEDNHINMKLLEQFIRRLKVRWQTAVNGREAVSKWRQGGFHLVLMDIQLPVMTGIEATKEIRRLERVNGIGVFSHGGCEGTEEGEAQGVKEEDALGNKARLFKSPVIIVALTASNLQSDRHEALAAGCNDFLTKVCGYSPFFRLGCSAY
jgi:osomolarity two-component system response regulator SSK1